jgi:serine/threonine-protein kinase RsbW
MGGSYLISGLATDAGLTELHDLLDRVRAEHAELAAGDLAMLETALIEIAGNVVEHGTPPGGIRYEFTLDVGDDGLRGRLVDSGDEVVLEEAESGEPGEMAESGRGLLLARAVLTELRYERQLDRNVWFLTRLLPGSEPAAGSGGGSAEPPG